MAPQRTRVRELRPGIRVLVASGAPPDSEMAAGAGLLAEPCDIASLRDALLRLVPDAGVVSDA